LYCQICIDGIRQYKKRNSIEKRKTLGKQHVTQYFGIKNMERKWVKGAYILELAVMRDSVVRISSEKDRVLLTTTM
jgi:hypothetical protein